MIRAIEGCGESGRLAGQRFLIADDCPDHQLLFATILRREGALVQLVDNGQQALVAVVDAQQRGQAFDMVLLDMQMPLLDGFATAVQLRQGGYRGRVLALTANAMLGTQEKCLAAGCDGYATKPIFRDALLAAILKQLTVSASGPQRSLRYDPAHAMEQSPNRRENRGQRVKVHPANDWVVTVKMGAANQNSALFSSPVESAVTVPGSAPVPVAAGC